MVVVMLLLSLLGGRFARHRVVPQHLVLSALVCELFLHPGELPQGHAALNRSLRRDSVALLYGLAEIRHVGRQVALLGRALTQPELQVLDALGEARYLDIDGLAHVAEPRHDARHHLVHVHVAPRVVWLGLAQVVVCQARDEVLLQRQHHPADAAR